MDAIILGPHLCATEIDLIKWTNFLIWILRKIIVRNEINHLFVFGWSNLYNSFNAFLLNQFYCMWSVFWSGDVFLFNFYLFRWKVGFLVRLQCVFGVQIPLLLLDSMTDRQESSFLVKCQAFATKSTTCANHQPTHWMCVAFQWNPLESFSYFPDSCRIPVIASPSESDELCWALA